MAGITEQRLKEMEDEMSRFEEEILAEKAAGRGGRFIIGARTYDQVRAHLGTGDESGPPQAGPPQAGPHMPYPMATAPPPPPPPDSSAGPSHSPAAAPSGAPPMRPPPPPPGAPPPRPPPSFLPPQLRYRAPPPPPPGGRLPYPPRMPMPPRPPPTGGPPRGPPPMPPHPHGFHGGPMGQPPGMAGPHHPPYQGMPYPDVNRGFYPGGDQTSGVGGGGMEGGAHPGGGGANPPGAVIEQRQVIYAAPVLHKKPAKETKVKSSKVKQTTDAAATATPGGGDIATGSIGPTAGSFPDAMLGDVAPGIELNVPLKEIDAERSMFAGPSADPVDVAMDAEGFELTEAGSRKEKKEKKKKFVRTAAGQVWEDPTLAEWDTDDFRVFAGDLGNEVTDEMLTRAFAKYPSFVRAKVIRNKRSNKTKGYGFVSFRDPNDFARAIREMNGKYVGNRPIKLRKSAWKDRQIDLVKKKEKEKKRMGYR